MGKLRDEALKRIRNDFRNRQAVDDINRQMEGRPFDAQASRDVARASHPISRGQRRVLDALNAPLVNDLDAIFERRTKVIMALVASFRVSEPLSMGKMLETQPAPELARQLGPVELAQGFRKSVFGPVEKVMRCFVCIANALALYPDDPSLASLTRTFANHCSLARHFTNAHLATIDPRSKGEYPVCSPGVHLIDRMHLQCHAEEVHGNWR